ncbi:MAG: hypothetical protein K6T71_04345 [Candidatus Bipolaricaulota bacterium]|nr:hypothetical protein [Candidatus Bipolaricaulota bacterium]
MRVGILLVVALAGLSLTATAQSFNPIIEQNSVDGLLLGAEGSYKFFGWLEPSLAVAYGLQSQQIRYRAGISTWALTVSLLDWPRTALLGRIGESGLKGTLNLSEGLPIVGDFFGGPSWLERELGGSSQSRVSGFFGTPWPWTEDPNPPDIAYVLWESSSIFRLPFGIELGISQRTLLGWWQLGVLPSEFRYSQTNLSLRYEALSVSFSYGDLENKSNLPGFIFVQGVKGESTTIKGDQFWAVQFERAFDVMTVSVPVPLLPQPLGLLVQGGIFLQVSNASKIELPSDGQQEGKRVWQNLLSWGVSLVLSFDRTMGAKARADFVFTRDGQFHFLFGF